MNNAFSTFFVAGLYMLFWDRFLDGVREKRAGKIVTSLLLCFVPILTAAPLLAVTQLSFDPAVPGAVIRVLAVFALLVPSVLTVEGGLAMAALGAAFYVLRRWRWAQTIIHWKPPPRTYTSADSAARMPICAQRHLRRT